MNKDLGENLFMLDVIRPVSPIAAYDARANGALNTVAQIDLADYNYPKEILVQISVGVVAAGGTLDVVLKSGDVAATIETVENTFTQILAEGVVTYHFKPTKRFCNVLATVAVAAVHFEVTMVMGSLGWGSSGQA